MTILFSLDPNYRQVPVTYEDKNPRLRLYKYTPERQGPHNVQITYKNQNIPNTPAVVNAKNDLTKIRIHSFEGMLRMLPFSWDFHFP